MDVHKDLRDDPGLQPVDLLRHHTEQQEINVIPMKAAVAVHRTRIARKSGARQTSFLAHLLSVLPFRNQCAVRCHRMNLGETTLHMPEKKLSEDDSVWNPSTTPRARCQNCWSKGQNCGHRASNAHRADNERSVDCLVKSESLRGSSPQEMRTYGVLFFFVVLFFTHCAIYLLPLSQWSIM